MFRQAVECLPHITKCVGDISEELGVFLDYVYIVEPARVLYFSLEGLQVENSPEALSVYLFPGPFLQLAYVIFQKVVNQLGAQHNVRIAQKAYEVVLSCSHERILEIDDPQPVTLQEKVAALEVPMYEDPRLCRQFLADALHMFLDDFQV